MSMSCDGYTPQAFFILLPIFSETESQMLQTAISYITKMQVFFVLLPICFAHDACFWYHTHPSFNIWKIKRAFTATLVSYASPPPPESFSSDKSTFIPVDTPPPTLHYILHTPWALSHYANFFTFLHQQKVQFPPLLLQPPTYLSLWFSTPMSVFLVLLHRDTYIYTYIWKGNMLTEVNNSQRSRWEGTPAQQDGLFTVPLKPQFACTQGSMNVSVQMSKHARACLCVVSRTTCSCLTPSTSVLATIVACPTGITAVCQGSSDTS